MSRPTVATRSQILLAFVVAVLLPLASAIARDRAPENLISFTSHRLPFGDDFGIGGFAYTNGMAFLGNEDADGKENYEGIVYMAERIGTSWTVTARLRPPISESGSHYGKHLAASNNTLAVSAPALDSVFIYTHDGTTWTLHTTLGDPLHVNSTYTGKPVALDGDTLVTTENEVPFSSTGGLGVYRRTGDHWDCVTSFPAALSRAPSGCSDVLDVIETTSGCLIACSAPEGMWKDDSSLSIYRITGTSWSLQHQIHHTCSFEGTYVAYVNSWNGHNVALARMGEEIGLIWGFMGADTWGTLSGMAEFLTYDGTSWTLETPLYPSDPKIGDLFGCSVDLLHTSEGTFAAVGAVRSDNAVARGGAFYLFERVDSTWNQLAKVAQPDGFMYDDFGQTVGLSIQESQITAWASASHLGDAWYALDLGLTSPSAQTPATHDAPHERDTLGAAVAISGDWAAVASPLDDEAAHDAGAVYIYHRVENNWTCTQKIAAPDASPIDCFGTALAMTTDTLAVGSWNHNGFENARDPLAETDSGAVYLWRLQGTIWQLEDTVRSNNPTSPDKFGQAVDLLGNLLIVGARSEDITDSQEGAAYLFRRSGSSWERETVLKPADGVSTTDYAQDVSLCEGTTGAYALVSYNGGNNTIDVYRRLGDNWTLGSTIVSDATAYYARAIGSHIGPNGYPIVTVICHSPNYCVHVYRTEDGQNWHKEASLTAADSHADITEARIAIAPAPGGLVAILGAKGFGSSDQERGSGAAYIYRNRDRAWALQEIIPNPTPRRGDVFGQAVALVWNGSRCTALIGAPGDDTVSVNGGAAYFYNIDLDSFSFPSFFLADQHFNIESDNTFWCGAWDFVANDWYATANGPGPAAIDIPLRTGRWIGTYLYDYATASYQEGKHLYVDSTLD